MSNNVVDVTAYKGEIFCLKRDVGLSNLTPVECIRTVKKSKNDTDLKIASIQLYDPEGNITMLEMWNDDAVDGVEYLWSLLQQEEEVLLHFTKLEIPSDPKERRKTAYRIVPPTYFMQEHLPYIKDRIVAQSITQGQPCDLSKQCKKITIPHHVHLVSDRVPLRHFSLWHKTYQEQQEDENPSELQRLIFRASGESMLAKRNEPDVNTHSEEKAGTTTEQTDDHTTTTANKTKKSKQKDQSNSSS